MQIGIATKDSEIDKFEGFEFVNVRLGFGVPADETLVQKHHGECTRFCTRQPVHEFEKFIAVLLYVRVRGDHVRVWNELFDIATVLAVGFGIDGIAVFRIFKRHF